jgi:hypothetical protein
MLLTGRIVKREETSNDPMADANYLIGVSAMNLGKNVGDSIDLVAVDRLGEVKLPDWALTLFRQRFPDAAFTNDLLRRQFHYWHRKILPLILKGRR